MKYYAVISEGETIKEQKEEDSANESAPEKRDELELISES